MCCLLTTRTRKAKPLSSLPGERLVVAVTRAAVGGDRRPAVACGILSAGFRSATIEAFAQPRIEAPGRRLSPGHLCERPCQVSCPLAEGLPRRRHPPDGRRTLESYRGDEPVRLRARRAACLLSAYQSLGRPQCEIRRLAVILLRGGDLMTCRNVHDRKTSSSAPLKPEKRSTLRGWRVVPPQRSADEKSFTCIARS